MPKFLEDRLAQGAKKAGLKGKDAQAYIYGAMNNQGYMRGNKETARGRALQRKHDRDQRGAKRQEHSKARQALDHRFPSR
jgi:hypothetical protein